MIDKIIIEGIDVSRCRYYNPNIKMDCLLYPLQPDACKNNPNCYYKQLQTEKDKVKEFKKCIEDSANSRDKLYNAWRKQVDDMQY